MKSAGITNLMLLVSNLYLNSVSAESKDLTIIDELRSHYIKMEKNLWEYFDTQSDRNLQLKKVYESHRLFVTQKLRLNSSDGEYSALNRYYEWNLLQRNLVNVDEQFENFKDFINQYTVREYDKIAGLDIADTVLNDKQLSIPQIFRVIDNVMIKPTIYYRAMMDGREQICATNQSIQQFLFSLYSDIALTELKGYTMIQFSWMILRIYAKGNFSHEATNMREEFEILTEKMQALLQEVLKRANRVGWTCDAHQHKEDDITLTRLLQGYVESEVDMNVDNTCQEKCGQYSNITKVKGCYKDLYCSRTPRGNNHLQNYQCLDSDNMWICPSVNSWWKWLIWHCSCFCMCDEQGIKSDKYFNLRPTLSNTTGNMIVMGIRFIKYKNVFNIQIQEGVLEKRGDINLSTIRWKPVDDDYPILDPVVPSSLDYHAHAGDHKSIDLDVPTGIDPTDIITGVRFRVVGKHLKMETRHAEFDFETGKLLDDDSNSFWIWNGNTAK